MPGLQIVSHGRRDDRGRGQDGEASLTPTGAVVVAAPNRNGDKAMIISSQKYRDADTVDAKIAAADYVVTIATITDSDGNEYSIVVDGHHSHAAAVATGNMPVYVESDYNYQAEVGCIGFDSFLADKWIDSDWYDIESGINVF